MTRRQTIISATLSATFVLLTFAFFNFLYPFHIHNHEQLQFFRFGADYFCDSIVALGLKIADISNTSLITSPAAWQDKVKNKILTIYYPDNVRNKVIEYLKARGFNVSTYLGKPIVKFNQLYVKVERLNNVI